jgi:flagellar export protein FliJ
MEYLALEKLQLAVAALERRIQQNESTLLEAVENRKAILARGIPAAELQSACEFEIALKQQRVALQAQWKEARLKWERQLRAYQAARRKRETLENLRSQQAERYNRELSKREQATIDDVFLTRHGRRQ